MGQKKLSFQAAGTLTPHFCANDFDVAVNVLFRGNPRILRPDYKRATVVNHNRSVTITNYGP